MPQRISSNEVTPACWQIRATAAELLSLSFSYPRTDMLARAVASGEWAAAAVEIANALSAKLPNTFAQDISNLTCGTDGASHDADSFMHVLRAEYTRLFVGSPDAVVLAYEGMCRAEEEGVQGLMFVNQHTLDVEQFCKECGLGQPSGTNEPLDYVATELELLEYLAGLAAGIIEPPENGPAFNDFPGGSPAQAYELFVDEHAKAWMPRFAAWVKEESNIPFYRCAATLLAELMR